MRIAHAAMLGCVVMVFAVGCGGSGDSSSSATTQASTSQETTTHTTSTSTAPVTSGQNAANVLGVSLATTNAGKPGVVVKSIPPDKKTLIHAGDVIVAYNGKPVSTVGQLGRMIGTPEIGDEFEITVIRGSHRVTIRELQSSTTYLGVSVKDVKGAAGATVDATDPSGPGAKAGIKAGDVITEIGKTQVKETKDLLVALGEYQPGDKVTIAYTRGSKELKTTAVLTTRPGTP
jgi:S1-C subfamily serine protease